jgi:hypothetical protein
MRMRLGKVNKIRYFNSRQSHMYGYMAAKPWTLQPVTGLTKQ